MNLINLNIDCLIEIFKYLPDRDLHNVTKVSKQFKKIVIENVYKHCKIPLYQIKFPEMVNLLQQYGSNLWNIEIGFGYVPQMKTHYNWSKSEITILLLEYCPNLRKLEIEIDFNEVRNEVVDFLKEYINHLDEFVLRANTQLSNDFFAIRNNCKRFGLFHVDATLVQFNYFKNLQSITFNDCIIKIDSICDLLKNVDNNLKFFEWIDTLSRQIVCEDFIKLVNTFYEYNKNLEILKIQINYFECR